MQVGANDQDTFIRDEATSNFLVNARAGGSGNGDTGGSGGGARRYCSGGLSLPYNVDGLGNNGGGGPVGAGGGAGSLPNGRIGGFGVLIDFGGHETWYGAGGGAGENRRGPDPGGGGVPESGSNYGGRYGALPSQGAGGGGGGWTGHEGSYGPGGSGIAILRYARCPTYEYALTKQVRLN